MNSGEAAMLLRTLAHQDAVDAAELAAIWRELPVVRSAEILGPWRGTGFATGHPVMGMLTANHWWGKNFISIDRVQPLILSTEDGGVRSDVEMGRGEASLWHVEYQGEVTASMVYDGQPVIDHFKRVDEDTLLGVMNGTSSHLFHDGAPFYFLLARAEMSPGKGT